MTHRTPYLQLPSLMVLVACAVSAPSVTAYHVEISDTLAGGDFYKTSTLGAGFYTRFTGGPLNVAVPPNPDIDRTPQLLSDDRQPLSQGVSDIGQLRKLYSLSAREGSNTTEGGTTVTTVGTARQSFNIGGTFKIVADANEANAGFVNLLAKGMVDGFTRVVAGQFTDAAASYSASIFIENLGTITATSTATATSTQTVGASATLSKSPGVTGSAESSVQKSSNGTAPQNFFMLGKVPLNTALNWNFTMTLEARNEETRLGFYSLATSWARDQFVNLVPQGERLALNKADPLLSETVLQFEASTGHLSLHHPSAVGPRLSFGTAVDEDGDLVVLDDFDASGFLPEVEAILNPDGTFSSGDALLHTLLAYDDLQLAGIETNGGFTFVDSRVEFIDPLARANVLASARLTDIKADSSSNTFTARIADFVMHGLSPGASPLGQALASAGGTLWLDPSIIAVTNGFTQSGATGPYTVVGTAATVVPLPSSACFAVGAYALLMARLRGRRKADSHGRMA